MKFGKLFERLSMGDLKKAERHIDKAFASIGIDVEFTKHFIERVNHKRNEKDITVEELEDIFDKALKTYGRAIENMGDKYNGILTDMSTWVNLPFVIRKNGSGMPQLVAKTVMRTKQFFPSNREKKFFV
jgi:hypothetical protein